MGMLHPSKLAIAHWSKTPLYVSEEYRYSVYPWLYEAAEFRHHAGHRILEVGCGTGCDLLQFAKHGAHATGIDVTPRHVRLARERVRGMAEVHEADARALPFEDETFDYVYSHGVLHHIKQPRLVVDEIFRVLRPNGRFNVHVYARWSYYTVKAILRHGRDWKLWIENSRDPVHIDFYTRGRLRKLFAPAILKIRRYQLESAPRLAGMFGWFLVAKGKKPSR